MSQVRCRGQDPRHRNASYLPLRAFLAAFFLPPERFLAVLRPPFFEALRAGRFALLAAAFFLAAFFLVAYFLAGAFFAAAFFGAAAFGAAAGLAGSAAGAAGAAGAAAGAAAGFRSAASV